MQCSFQICDNSTHIIRVEEKREKAAQRVFSVLLNDLLLLGIATCYLNLGQSSADDHCKSMSFVHDNVVILIGLEGVLFLVLLVVLYLKNKKQGLKYFRSYFQTVYGEVIPTLGLDRPKQSPERTTNANAN